MTSDSPAPTWAVIAGGGTAGHLLPGLAVSRELVERGHSRDEIHFVGASRGIEAELVPAAGFGITLLPGRGVQRKLTMANIGAVVGLVRAMFQAVVLVRRRRPKVVLTLGGFASAAVAIAAVLWRIPLVVAEQNARAGAANRLVARFARACAVPFPETDLPNAIVTGNPVRDEMLEAARTFDRAAARRELGLPLDRTVVVVFAGSLGARRLNTAVQEAVGRWSDRDDLAIHHVVGARDWNERPTLDPGRLVYQPVRYEARMDLALVAADLVVCRSGGTTVAELAVIGVPAVLIPLPIATRDHQRANAASLVGAGAAVLLPDDELEADRLVAEVDKILSTGQDGLSAMAVAARSVGHPEAAGAVADLVEAAASRGRGPRS